jgi:CDGSH-type Zn-finger protein
MADVQITASENGPYLVKGDIELVDHNGEPVSTEGKSVVALCRCGGSTTKPFCDGTHSKVGFQGALKAVEQTEDQP